MRRLRFGAVVLLLSILSAIAQGQVASGVLPRVPDKPDPRATYLFYLHGRIVEDQGANAVSPEYGQYEYAAIVGQLASQGFTVVSEARAANTDPEAYADAVVRQIQRLLDSGVEPGRVTVIGASKGAVIAMLISTRLSAPIRYVLLANCNDFIFKMFPLSLHGHVLSIVAAIRERLMVSPPVPDGPPPSRRELTRFRLQLAEDANEAYVAIYADAGPNLVVVHAATFNDTTNPADLRAAATSRGGIFIPDRTVVMVSGVGPCFEAVAAHVRALAGP